MSKKDELLAIMREAHAQHDAGELSLAELKDIAYEVYYEWKTEVKEQPPANEKLINYFLPVQDLNIA